MDNALPPNVVLRLLFNESDAFQHIRDIVDSALPHAELICGHIQVEDTATVSLQQSDETFCESAERRIGSRGLHTRSNIINHIVTREVLV